MAGSANSPLKALVSVTCFILTAQLTSVMLCRAIGVVAELVVDPRV